MQNILNALHALPVNAVLDAIVQHTDRGGVAIVIAEPASGATLLVPTMLQMVTNTDVLVVEPRRFLAISAAETLAALSATPLGEQIGYTVSRRGVRDDSSRAPTPSSINFTTYGYALAANTLRSSAVVILDGVHEATTDIAISRALIKEQREAEESVIQRVVVMAAALDIDTEVEYWAGHDPQVFQVAATSDFTCDRQWQPSAPVHLAALDLVDAGSQGVLVFVSGYKEIEDTMRHLTNALIFRGSEAPAIELAILHAQSDADERNAALAAPAAGVAKILVGTNVLETGIDLTWVDAGVSSGTHKESVVVRESGAIALRETPLSVATVDRQAGRTNQFCNSRFILCGTTSPEQLPLHAVSELLRLPLTQIILRCLSLGLSPDQLDFTPALNSAMVAHETRRLRRFGFIDTAHLLTDAGQVTQTLPIGLEAAALLCHAEKIGVLRASLIAAALLESGGLRLRNYESHNLNGESDLLDAVKAFTTIYLSQHRESAARNEEMLALNVQRKKYYTTLDILKTLERVLEVRAECLALLPTADATTDVTLTKLRQCILAAGINQIGSMDTTGTIRLLEDTNSYRPDNGTVVPRCAANPLTARLKQVKPRDPNKSSFVVADHITVYTLEDLRAFDTVRPGIFRFCDTPNSTDVSAFGHLFYRLPKQPVAAEPTQENHDFNKFHETMVNNTRELMTEHPPGLTIDPDALTTITEKTAPTLGEFLETALQQSRAILLSNSASQETRGTQPEGKPILKASTKRRVIKPRATATALTPTTTAPVPTESLLALQVLFNSNRR